MSTVITDNIAADDYSEAIPLTELGNRVINTYRLLYTGGEWNPDNNFAWVPGQHYDYTPISASSRIKVYCNIPAASRNAAHNISNWIFYANGVELGRHSISGNHHEDCSLYIWDTASWGTSQGRIGYQMRSYANDNNETRLYTTRYWDGSGSQQNCYGHFLIEEYLPGV